MKVRRKVRELSSDLEINILDISFIVMNIHCSTVIFIAVITNIVEEIMSNKERGNMCLRT